MYENFRAAIYVTVHSTRQLADPETFERQFERVAGQLKFDKVYVEVYRSRVFATDEEIAAVKGLFESRGVETAGGVTLSVSDMDGQFISFDYENPDDRTMCRRAVETAARHFDRVILDDFFFYNTKSDADIRAKGDRSWSEYRLHTMREVSESLVLEPARKVNPDVKVTIKYPNWYEHFHATGYDLEHQPHLFDGIYTGTETRDPYVTDQWLQQYQSYLTYRYFSNVRPDGANLGGWVDTFDTRYIDRYAEQLWDTLFAGAPEITLFNWHPMASGQPVEPGEREDWAGKDTSFDWKAMSASYRASGDRDSGPGWARAAGYALEQADRVLGRLGRPVGVWAYRPCHSTGEEFLHNYLGNIGFPIELTPDFPEQAGVLLLAESAKGDPDIVERIKGRLRAGANVIITSGLLRALQDRGLRDIAEIEHTGRAALVDGFVDGYGPGAGTSLNEAGRDHPPVLLPEIRFHTNDVWPIVRGVAGSRGFPVVLMNRYSAGILHVLTVPENISDLYNYPRPLLTQIKRYLLGDFPVRLESEPLVSLFVYDNDTFIVQSFRRLETTVTVSVAGDKNRLQNLLTGAVLQAEPLLQSDAAGTRGGGRGAARADFQVILPPHSYAVFEVLD